MFESRNIKDDIAKAIVLRDELKKYDDLKDKYSRFTYLFPTFEDKIICKAIFDIIFISEIRLGKFIDQMINGLNKVVPQNFSEMIETYTRAVAFVSAKIKEDNKKAADDGGERYTQEEKQGTTVGDDKHGRSDTFIVMSPLDSNRDFVAGQIIAKNGDAVISTLSKEELNQALIDNNNLIEAKKEQERKNAEEEARRRAAYEESLAKRRNKTEFAKVSNELQRVYDNKD